MESTNMSLHEVWSNYDKEKKIIKKHQLYCMKLGAFCALCSYITSLFKTNDYKWTLILSLLSILTLVIAIYQILQIIICSRKVKKLNDWFEQNYKCPFCGSRFGEQSPHALSDTCKRCGSLINFTSRNPRQSLNINQKILKFASSLLCAILALALLSIGYLYPYSIPKLDLNPNSVYRKLAKDMVFVQGGPAHIGATDDQKPETDKFPDEHPDTTIKVADFYICKHEVTQDLWKKVMGDNPSDHDGDSFPVESVSYLDCLKFIKTLNKICGQNYRLPTEEEWEYAARGGQYTNHTKYAGSRNIEDVAWYDKNSGKTTHAVCLKNSNELGLYDMNGNVLEWCMSFYTKNGYTERNTEDTLYVLRGGSFNSDSVRSRVAYRIRAEKRLKKNGMGLRLVR